MKTYSVSQVDVFFYKVSAAKRLFQQSIGRRCNAVILGKVNGIRFACVLFNLHLAVLTKIPHVFPIERCHKWYTRPFYHMSVFL